MQLKLKQEFSRVQSSIVELERWKFNRERKAEERAKEGNYKKPLTSDALMRAIEILKRYKGVIENNIK